MVQHICICLLHPSVIKVLACQLLGHSVNAFQKLLSFLLQGLPWSLSSGRSTFKNWCIICMMHLNFPRPTVSGNHILFASNKQKSSCISYHAYHNHALALAISFAGFSAETVNILVRIKLKEQFSDDRIILFSTAQIVYLYWAQQLMVPPIEISSPVKQLSFNGL